MPIADIERLLSRTMGLDSASVGTSTIERAVRQRMKTSGLEAIDKYEEYLRDSAPELQELIEAVVVPETWFFRDEEAFVALVRMVTGFLRDRPATVFRFLSFPCSTGEEPYSIAMALEDGGLPRGQMTVDAVDISMRALVQARRGVYGRNSFRSRNLEFRKRHFHPVEEGYAIAEWMSRVVTFHHGNLVSGGFLLPWAAYDVIFCRNLLIYFDRSTQERVLQTLGSALALDGILFVGPAEAFLAASCGFTSVNDAASFAFRKTSAMRSGPKGATLARLGAKVIKDVRKTSIPVARPLLAQPRGQRDTQPADLPTAQCLADEGRLREAAECCERNLVQFGPSAEAYHLLGVLRDAAGECERAAECYRRAVYLEPSHLESLTHLALVSETQGDSVAAQRLRGRARRASLLTGHRNAVKP